MVFSRKRNVLATENNRKSRTGPARNRTRYSIHWIYPTLLSVLFVALLSFYLCQHARLIRTQYSIGRLKVQKVLLEKEERSLHLDIENLEALERVEKIATNRLKMINPAKRMVLDLNQPTNTAELDEINFE